VAAAEAAQVAEEVVARHAEAEAQRAAEHADALAALAKATTEVRGLLAELSARIEEQAIGLAWELTAAIVEREVAVADSADTVRRVLRVLSPGALGTVRLHPAVVSDEAAEALRGAGLTVIADPALGRADALIERDGRVVDLRISEALERVRQVLA
jgi:flagellar assembly protein FliH